MPKLNGKNSTSLQGRTIVKELIMHETSTHIAQGTMHTKVPVKGRLYNQLAHAEDGNIRCGQ